MLTGSERDYEEGANQSCRGAFSRSVLYFRLALLSYQVLPTVNPTLYELFK
jgi:hypothetical protein